MTLLETAAQKAMIALAECAVLMQSDHLDDIINELAEALNGDSEEA